jgi:glycosyltransferase involved in cell wall biosynthesis
MAAGCCPVAMGVGGIPEVLGHPALGWLIAPGDSDAFAAAMRAALTTTAADRLSMGKKLRAHIQEHFNAQVQFSLLASLLEHEAERRRKRNRRLAETPTSAKEQPCSYR